MIDNEKHEGSICSRDTWQEDDKERSARRPRGKRILGPWNRHDEGGRGILRGSSCARYGVTDDVPQEQANRGEEGSQTWPIRRAGDGAQSSSASGLGD